MEKERMISIRNEGKEIVETNYWDSVLNENNKFFLSGNDGCYRLLIPEGMKGVIKDILTGKEVIITKGTIRDTWNEGLELLFEDNTDTPFHIIMALEAVDRVPRRVGEYDFSVWVSGENGIPKKVHSVKCYFRKHKTIPYLKSRN